jgi:hypothetical protein
MTVCTSLRCRTGSAVEAGQEEEDQVEEGAEFIM